MVALDFQNVFNLEKGLSQEVFHKLGEQLPVYLESFQRRDQGFYQVIDDDQILDDIEDFCTRVEGRYDDIVVLGIGGSALGTKAIRDAFHPSDRKPHLHILDNVGSILYYGKRKTLGFESNAVSRD
jgi:glucose-6-phosphate isomerase